MAAMRDPTERRARPHVLAVEDNGPMREILTVALEAMGCRATVVADPAEALAVARREPVAVVLLDLHLAGLDGRVHARPLGEACGAPVVALTAERRPEGRLPDPFAGWIEKPWTAAALARGLSAAAPGLVPDGT